MKRAAHKQAESAPHGSSDLKTSFPLLLRSDDEQTWHTRQCYKTMRRRNATSTNRTHALSFDWRRAISFKIPQRHSSRGWTTIPHPHFPPGEQSLPSDGRRTRPDHLAWLTGAGLWLCFCLAHLFYMRGIPRPARKDKPGVSPSTGFWERNVQKEVVKYISTTGNFPGVERVEGELDAMR